MTVDGKHCESTIDFFLLYRHLDATVLSVDTDLDTTLKPHRPVVLQIGTNTQGISFLVFQAYQNIPTKPLIGPQLQHPNYDVVLEVLEDFYGRLGGLDTAHVTLEGDLRAEGIQILDRTCRAWNELAWQELKQVTGSNPT
eukprot:3859221-Pyramimonas_sp.AAC.1